MRPPLYYRLLDKAHAALLAAVEVYNKPAFSYREETFCILAINAWELLLKARILASHNNDQRCIRVYESRRTKSGNLSAKKYLKRNRTGNPMTIGLQKCIDFIEKDSNNLHPIIKSNLDALIEIRDNATHYVNASPILIRQVLEIGTAAIKNFVIASKKWFSVDFSESLSIFLPLAFINGSMDTDSVTVGADESRLIKYLRNLANTSTDDDSDYAVAVRVRIKLEKSKLDSASKVVISTDSEAIAVTLSEEDIREKYPWDYTELTRRMSDRYSDFKQNNQFHKLRKPLLSDQRFVKARFLDPGNPKSPKKDFYNANVLQVFDTHYTRR